MQSPIRVAAVSYLNTAPLIEGLDACADLEVERLVPSRIVDRLTQTGPDRADLGLVSVIDAARAEEDLALLSCGMIGCEGPTLTVRLYASIDPARITRLHADTDSHTSVALAQVILHERYGVRPEVVPFNARECASDGADWPEAALLIGDKVVASSPPAVRATTQIDLGSAWHELTGLPVVYALWMCRREAMDDPRVHAGAALLDRQRRRNLARLDAIVSRRARAKGWPDDLARRYVGELLR
ncbi:MAG: menaquinone biosynthetic enzyme MqnA/MqnD family protein, partial [Phycisphaerales bacterium JB059]